MYRKNKYKTRTIICKGCGKPHTADMPANRQYCSAYCSRTSPKPQRKTGRIVECAMCGNQVYRSLATLEAHANHFCSHKCANDFQAKNKVAFECKMCHNTFYWSKSRLKDNNPTYCTIECRNTDEEWIRRASTNGNMAQNRKKGPNKLELLGRQILLNEDIIFEEQILIADKISVDVLIPDKKIIIQWDGDYWHGHPSKLKNGIPDLRQQKRMNLDKSQDAYLRKCGFTVLRFWEHEVIEEMKNNNGIIKERLRLATK